MKSMVKKIFLTASIIVCCGVVLIGGAWCSTCSDDSPCTNVCIMVKDSLERQFVGTTEIEGYLKQKGCYPLAQTMESIDCHTIEQCLLKHDMVRNAECYKSPFGAVHITVNQRIPILSVITSEGSYYVDSDRRVMPIRQHIHVDVPTFKGCVGQRAATEEYYDFVVWLNTNQYWNKRIKNIHVSTPKHLVLSQEGQTSKIILGELNDYAEKLGKLHTLYTQGLDNIGHPTYREYDLRFNGQVVGRK